jgi:hypothetical protein
LITIFTTPKPFTGQIDIIQRNAIESWTCLEPRPEVIIFGDEPGAVEAAKDLGVTFGGEVMRNEYGTPLVNDIFARAQRMVRHDLLCYVNADIILLDDFMEAVARVRHLPEFLMVGRRLDIEMLERLNFDQPGWDSDLRKRIEAEAELQCIYRIDYFLFTNGLYRQVPPLALGRMYWDSWLIYHARQSGSLVIDATSEVKVLHQNHDYAHVKASSMFEVLRMPEAAINMKLAGGIGQSFSASSANRILTHDGIERQPLSHFFSLKGIKPFLILNPVAGFFFRPLWRVYDLIFPWRIAHK